MVEMTLPAGQRGSEIRPTFSTRARFCITIFLKRFLFHRYERFACMFVCTCVPGALGGQRASGLLVLELLMIVSLHIGSGKQTWVLCESNQYS